MAKFNKGDRVRLIDEYYNHPAFLSHGREYRKHIAAQAGKRGIVDVTDLAGFVTDGAGKCDVKYGSGKRRRYVTASEDLFERVAEPSTHVYTPAQIHEARDIITHILLDACAPDHRVMYGFTGRVTWANVKAPGAEPRYAEATCSPHDAYSPHIGLMVALCRAIGKRLPSWL